MRKEAFIFLLRRSDNKKIRNSIVSHASNTDATPIAQMLVRRGR